MLQFEKALAEMREREEQYHSIFEAATDAMFIANLGGTFQVESTPGAGTRICVRIPMQPCTK